jgi:N-acetyl-anhydromuramyl-L-alanine amidase AmpD
MNIIQSKKLFKSYGSHNPNTITIHHTAGGRVGSEDYLKTKGLGYHFMIDKDGTVHQYNEISDVVGHSSKANRGYVGVSFVCGGKLGPASQEQITAVIELADSLRNKHNNIKYITDHATIDILVAKRGGKSDPQWPGEKVEQNNWDIKHKYIDLIATRSSLKAIKYNPHK